MEGASGTWRVLHGEANPDHHEATAARLADHSRIELRAVARVDAVVDALAEDDVDCVLLGSTLANGGWRDAVEAMRERDSDLPIVLYPEDADGEVASAAIDAGVTDYLPRSLDDGELVERIEDAVAEYERCRKLQDRSSRYEQIMETLPVSLYFKDEDARFVDVSDKMQSDLDVDPVGKTDAELFGDPDDPTGVDTYQDDVRVIEEGEAIVGKEERHKVQEGDIWVRSSKFPWTDGDGEIVGQMGVSRAVTGQKARERELREKSQRLEQFASFVSHDLRNPVNIAQGYLDLAAETGDEDAFEEVADALDRMETLIDDLLATVKEGEEAEEWIELAPFVDRVWTATETSSATLVVDVPEGATIGAVGGQFRQLLNNLFRNADDHGGEDVTITVGLTGTGFYVEDDGPGIDPVDRDTVFEYGHTEGGTGVGLTIVREIAASHGWDLSLTESEDGGARFEFHNCLLRQEQFQSVTEGTAVPIDETAEIGDPDQRGHLERRADDTMVLAGSGNNVWGDIEEHFFAYGTVDGDVRIEARLAELENVHRYSKAGLMIRDWPGEDSALGYVGGTPSEGIESIYRSFPGETIETEQFDHDAAVPLWYRLDWIDNTVVAATSTDGEEWTTVDRYPIAGRDPLSVGIASCSHDPERTCRAVFKHVQVVQLEPDGPAD